MTPDTVKAVPTALVGASLLLRASRLFRAHWTESFHLLLLGLLSALLGLVPPLLTKVIVDDALPASESQLLLVTILLGLFVSFALIALNALRTVRAQTQIQRIGAEASLLFYEKMLSLPILEQTLRPTGEVTARHAEFQRALAYIFGGVQTAFTGVVQLVVLPCVLLAIDPRLGMLVLVTQPLGLVLAVAMGARTRRIGLRATEHQAKSSAQQVEVIANARAIKGLSAEEDVLARMQRTLSSLRGAQLAVSHNNAVVIGGSATLRAVSASLFSLIAYTAIGEGRLSLGEFFAFSMYLGFLIAPLDQLLALSVGFNDATVSLGRFFALHELPDERVASKPLMTMRSGAAHIVCESVSFSYEGTKRVLSDASCEFLPGQRYAIVGPSGTGKSTLINLLLRMIEPTSGRVLLDSQDVRHMSTRSVRQNFGVVWQDAAMLRTTLRENITLGAERSSPAAIQRALRIAQLEDLVARMPSGLESHVTEWGHSLSTGERQRIAIARAIVRAPRALILDEATANLDEQTERQMLNALAELEKTTVLFVSHRPQPVRAADVVFYVLDGEIRGGLSHDTMMMNDYSYRRLWSSVASSSERRAVFGERRAQQ